MNKITKATLAFLLSVAACLAQVTTTQTTLSSALSGSSSGASAPTTVCVASATGVTAPQFNASTALTGLMVDKEFMLVNATTPVSTCFIVTRGYAGTRVTAHASGAVVWVGPTGGTLSSPYINTPKVAGTPCVASAEPYLPQILVGSEGYQNEIGWAYNCSAIASGVSLNIWTAIQLPINGGSTGQIFYGANDGGANNAITASIPGLPQVYGACVSIKLGHTLQAGANTFALNGGTATAIKSHLNIANNLGTAYAATGTWLGCYDGTEWVDVSQ